jgi:SLOG cluster2
MNTLLPPNALANKRLGISVSESPDLAQLGLLESHLRLSLAEIARSVLVANGKLAYGGHLLETGYTAFLKSELQKYSRRDRPLLICLAWPVHRGMALTELCSEKTELALNGEIVYLDPEGEQIDFLSNRGEQPIQVADPLIRLKSFTNLRRFMCKETHGRLLIGGKRHGYQGRMPGLLEEALISVEAQQPLYLAAGFGGVTCDIAQALGINNRDWYPGNYNERIDDAGLIQGLLELEETAERVKFVLSDNGLSIEENRKLAATHRPSDIASIVSLGLGRLRQRENEELGA